MKITKDIEKHIRLASEKLIKEGYEGYDWEAWLREGFEVNEFPWSCSDTYEHAGHMAMKNILIVVGEENKIHEFTHVTFTKDN